MYKFQLYRVIIIKMSTYKQTKALANMVENGGNMVIALKKAGYSDSMAKNPYKVVRIQGVSRCTDSS